MDVPEIEHISAIQSLHSGSTDEDIKAVVLLVSAKYPKNRAVAATLARALSSSGVNLSWNHSCVADVASTGGPSSLSTLLCPLFLCAAGAIVPKLGVPGRPAGGIDCLAQLPGFKSQLAINDVKSIIQLGGGYAHFLAKGDFAPLDGRMFRLRQATGTQEVPSLVTASLLSKKIALGIKYAGLDVRVASHGNFGRDWTTALENAELFSYTAQDLSIKAFPVLTDARFPYQPYIGRREALVALSEIFDGTESEWSAQHVNICRSLAAACLPRHLRPIVAHAQKSDLRTYFDRNIEDQGVKPGQFEELVEMTLSEHKGIIRAQSAGFLDFSLDGIREVLVRLQKGSDSSEFPDPVGVILKRRPGEWVDAAEAVASVRASRSLLERSILELTPFIGRTRETPFGPSIEGVHNE